MAELVAAGLGVALVPQLAVGGGAASVVYRPLARTPRRLETAAVGRAEAMTHALRVFLDQAVKASRQPKLRAAAPANPATPKAGDSSTAVQTF